MNAVNVDATWLDLLIGRHRRRLGDDMELDPELDQFFAEIEDVRTDASHNSGRIFPRQHHHTHGDILLRRDGFQVKFRNLIDADVVTFVEEG